MHNSYLSQESGTEQAYSVPTFYRCTRKGSNTSVIHKINSIAMPFIGLLPHPKGACKTWTNSSKQNI